MSLFSFAKNKASVIQRLFVNLSSYTSRSLSFATLVGLEITCFIENCSIQSASLYLVSFI